MPLGTAYPSSDLHLFPFSIWASGTSLETVSDIPHFMTHHQHFWTSQGYELFLGGECLCHQGSGLGAALIYLGTRRPAPLQRQLSGLLLWPQTGHVVCLSQMLFLSCLESSSAPHKVTLGSSYLDRFHSPTIFNFSINFSPHPLSVKLKDIGFHCAPLGRWTVMADSSHLLAGIESNWSAETVLYLYASQGPVLCCMTGT